MAPFLLEVVVSEAISVVSRIAEAKRISIRGPTAATGNTYMGEQIA
jgi:hypothetical protein